MSAVVILLMEFIHDRTTWLGSFFYSERTSDRVFRQLPPKYDEDIARIMAFKFDYHDFSMVGMPYKMGKIAIQRINNLIFITSGAITFQFDISLYRGWTRSEIITRLHHTMPEIVDYCGRLVISWGCLC